MIPVEQAVAAVVAAFQPLPAEIVGLDVALGRVLAEDVTANLTQPPTDVSAMDGYALRADDLGELPTAVRLIGQSAAGKSFSGTVGLGEAVRIFTGAAVPAGADTIVIQENVEQRQGQVLIARPPGAALTFGARVRTSTSGMFCCVPGGDFRRATSVWPRR